MATLVRVLEWTLEQVRMTELQAYERYWAHIKACPLCKPSIGRVCGKGLKLHDTWKLTEAKQPPPQKP